MEPVVYYRWPTYERTVMGRTPAGALRAVDFHHDPGEDFPPLELVDDEEDYDTW